MLVGGSVRDRLLVVGYTRCLRYPCRWKQTVVGTVVTTAFVRSCTCLRRSGFPFRRSALGRNADASPFTCDLRISTPWRWRSATRKTNTSIDFPGKQFRAVIIKINTSQVLPTSGGQYASYQQPFARFYAEWVSPLTIRLLDS